MATIRATVNTFGFNVLDVKFDMVGTGNAFGMVEMCLKATIQDYKPTENFWKEVKQEVLKDGVSSYYWGDALITLYYEVDGFNN
ncbi:hypothetical protein CPT_Moogle103 [Citrobacter phage Moogle]|uniref:Uncharacterized protein n=2 Tax=Mooglevirus moogle TaxID=1985304 RepID=A0A0A0RP10_9CAUD|nr:hypothetical protein CPT_Moogle103 [Citrobacter phage Moogle]AIW03840.1 hypothetical protein CPT_Moogle103 [Citrobacter phage Moogle]ARB06600.1 hypothetical protein CPT_Mijalis105 [Citrobacter phage Mijalis]